MSAVAIRRLIEEAAALPDLHGKPLLEKAISLADACNERQLAWEARLAFISATHEAPDPLKALAAFGWLLKEYDRAPDEPHKDISRLLWRYKWMLGTLTDYPNISNEQEDRALEDFRQRLLAAGFGLHAWYSAKMSSLACRGDTEAVASLLPEFRRMPRDQMSNCKACYPGNLAGKLRFLGHPIDEILQVMQPVIRGRATCSHVPANAWPRLAMDAVLNQLPEVLEWYRLCWTSTLSFVGDPMSHDDILDAALSHGFYADAWTLITRHSGRDWPQFTPLDQLEFLRQVRALFEVESDSSWPFPAALEFNGRNWSLVEFRDWVMVASSRLDAAFDKRNGNSEHQSRTTERLQEAATQNSSLSAEASQWRQLASQGDEAALLRHLSAETALSHPDTAVMRLKALIAAGSSDEAADFARLAATRLPASGALRAIFADQPQLLDSASRRLLDGDKRGRGHAATPKNADLATLLAAAPGRPVKPAKNGLSLVEVMADELPKNFHSRVLAQVTAAPASALSLLAVLRLATTDKLGDEPLVPLYALLRRDFADQAPVIAAAVEILELLHYHPPQILALARLALERGHPEPWRYQRILRDAYSIDSKERLGYAREILAGQGELLDKDQSTAVELLLLQDPPQKSEALVQARAAIAMKPDQVELRVELVFTLAAHDLDAALEIMAPLSVHTDPALAVRGLIETSYLYNRCEKPAEALEFCDRAYTLAGSKTEQDHLYRAALLNTLGRFAEALDEARSSSSGSRSFPALAALEALQRPTEALEEAEALMSRYAGSHSLIRSQAKALQQLGRRDEGIALIKPLTTGKNRNAWSFSNNAELLLQIYGDDKRHARHAASLRKRIAAESGS